MNQEIQIAAETAPDHRALTGCPACTAMAYGQTVEIPDHEYRVSYAGRYMECEACGTLFQKPMPTLVELASFYPPEYHSMTHTGLLNRIRNEVRIRRLSKLLTIEGAVLDYGCGDGAFLVQAAKKMPQRSFWGFEIADRAETTVLAGGKVTLLKGNPYDILGLLPRCGLITLNHVIEHLPDPSIIVTALVQKLLPGGVFEGQTPASDSLERSVFGCKWSGFHSPRHTVIFSRKGLTQMFERSGLSDPMVRGAFNPAGLAVSLASLPHKGAGHIGRSGLKWMSYIALASSLAPIDLWSGRPGIIDFVAYKRST